MSGGDCLLTDWAVLVPREGILLAVAVVFLGGLLVLHALEVIVAEDLPAALLVGYINFITYSNIYFAYSKN